MAKNLLIIIILIPLVSIFAALAGAVGIGGGGFFTPILMVFGRLSIFTAIPIASAIVVGVAFASTMVNIRNKTINYKLSLIFEPASIIGTIIGVQIHLVVSEEIIMTLFTILMILLTVRAYLKARKIRMNMKDDKSTQIPVNSNLSRIRILIGILGSLTAGILAALVGIGGGLIKVPMMNELGLPPILASGTGSFMVLITSISTTVQFIFYHRLDLMDGILFFILGFMASLIGTTLSRYNTRPEVIYYLLTLAIGSSTFIILMERVFL